MSSIKRGLLCIGLLVALAIASSATTKRVIVLTYSSNGTQMQVTGVMWYAITTGARPQTSGSLWVASGTSTGASTAENQAIQAGTIYEETFSQVFPVSTPTATIESDLIQYWTDRNAQIAGNGANIYYGVWYDGTSWSQN